MNIGRKISWLLFCLVNLCSAEITFEINKSEHKIKLMDDGKTLKEYSCALGKGGGGKKEKMGDNRTPVGVYRIVSISIQSGFHVFLHLSYPNQADIENGRSKGLINDTTFKVMQADIENGRLPSQKTVLGGNVGIHGIKNGLGWLGGLQSSIDWTQGCIAVTNDQIEDISKSIKVGTKVTILP